MKYTLKIFNSIAGLVLGLTLANQAQTAPVGKMTALQTSISRAGAELSVGAAISLGDSLRSNETGLGVIVFDDQSTAKIGPRSRLVIDEFVYNAKRRRGTVNIRMDRGVTRFYGGRISKKDKMTVQTPHIILGVRGGIVDVLIKNGETTGILRAGRLTCSANGKVRVITKPGFACSSDGGPLVVGRQSVDTRVLDSPSRIAGTNIPGGKGPGLDLDADCLTRSAAKLGLCQSRNGKRPGLQTGIRRPGGSAIPRVGSDAQGSQESPRGGSQPIEEPGT